MVTYSIEVVDRFEEAHPAEEYVYSPIQGDCELRETRVYRISGPEDKERLSEFVEDVLVDDVSQDWELFEAVESPSLSDYDSLIDVTLKSSVLDLEEEYLLEYCENHRDESIYDVEDITIVTRYYLRCDDVEDGVVDTVVRDLVNPVIHDWRTTNRDNGG